jgi:hypothetical protein
MDAADYEDYVEGLVEKARSFQPYCIHAIDSRFYDQLREAHTPFQALGEHLRAGDHTVVGLPLREDYNELYSQGEFQHRIYKLANSAYFANKMLSMIYDKTFAGQTFGTQHGSLTLCLDDAIPRWIQHEVFHFIHDKVLSSYGKERVQMYHAKARHEDRLTYLGRTRGEYSVDEYFANGGEFYVTKKRIFSPHRRLERKDPEFFGLLGRVLEGDEELLVPLPSS